MKIAVYARVSTDDQSTALQLRDLREYAQRRNLTIHKEYVDEGYSGSTSKRPALAKMLGDAKKRKFDLVLVWRFDRFARSTVHLLQALEEFKALGIGFVSYNENIDTQTPMGQMIFTISGAFAQLERDIIRERVLAGMATAKAQGKHLGRPATIDVDKALALKAEGHSNRKVAQLMGCTATTINRIMKGHPQ